MRPDIIWLVLGTLLIIAEMVTPSFFLIWFGIGALGASGVAYLGATATVQWIVFLALSAALVLCSRKFARKVTPGPPPLKTNIDEYLGETAVVIQRIDPAANTGLVRVKKEEWRADAAEVIEEGARVEVIGSGGAHLKVKRKEA
jgi:membrane protein implicated in regulation of membrane protease activity